MTERRFRIRPLTFVETAMTGYAAGDFWTAHSVLGEINVARQDGVWLWDKPDAQDWCFGEHPDREAAIAAATAWYEREVSRHMEELE